eukprot:7022929-Pyramimonas_sp.AAC.1
MQSSIPGSGLFHMRSSVTSSPHSSTNRVDRAFSRSTSSISNRRAPVHCVANISEKPHVAVVGAGWGGWGAAKALCEAGCRVTLLDGLPDPTGAEPYLTPTGKPFEAGTRGFWKDYPN